MNVVSSKVALKLVATMQVEYYVETVQIVRGGLQPSPGYTPENNNYFHQMYL